MKPRYNIILKELPIAIAVLDNKMRFVARSDLWFQKFGGDFVSIIGESFYKVLPNCPQELKKLHQDCLKGSSSSTKGHKVNLPNGREQWFSWNLKPSKDSDGNINGIIMILTDITEEKELKQKNTELTERHLKATKASKVGIWEYRIEDNNLIWDDNMFKIYGKEKSAFKSTYDCWHQTLHPEDREHIHKTLISSINEGKDLNNDFRVVLPNGSIRHIKAIAKVYNDGNGKPAKLIGTNWDITKLMTVKLALERTRESFRGAFEESSVGMALVALDGKFISVNQSLSKSLGYTSQELLQQSFQEITVKDDLKKDLDNLKELVNGKRVSYQIEKRYNHKNGTIVYVQLTVTAVKKNDGSLSHFISQVVDLTQMKIAEQRMLELHRKSQEQNNSLMNFAHIVSHNLRSHTANMTMLIEFLKTETDHQKKENLVDMLVSAVDNLNDTVTNLNEVVQIRAGSVEKMRPLNLYKTVKKVEKNIGALLLEKKATCKFKVSKSHYVIAIPAYLDSIFLNLFTNAIKYSCPTRLPILNISSLSENDFIKISFKDNGLGIDLKQHKDQLFGMYKTFHGHKDAKGIGLFITKNQVESMQGKITLESEVGKGTEFIIYLKKKGVKKSKKSRIKKKTG